MNRLLLGLVLATWLVGCTDPASPKEEVDSSVNVEEATTELKARIETLLDEVKDAEKPVIEDFGPLPCDDPPNDDPQLGRASLHYGTLVKGRPSVDAAKAMEKTLRDQGWTLLVNEGGPQGEFSFSATSEDGYVIVVSSSEEVVEATGMSELALQGDTPCVSRK